MGRRVAELLAVGATLSMTGCGKTPGQGAREAESARMGSQDKPWWHDMVEQQQANARASTTKLIETSRTYRRPATNPDIYSTGKGNRIAMVDRTTGDYLLSSGGDNENLVVSFDYMTKDDKLVCTFKTQWAGGFRMKWQVMPIRVFAIIETNQQTDEVHAARQRISIAKFAEFMAASPDFSNNPERDFVVIDAPREPGEQL
jgi:hypothetical protein